MPEWVKIVLMNQPNQKVLGVFTLTMINVAAIQSMRNLPLMASMGWASISFYLLAALGFFIPAALVSAELATGWATRGGVYTWVKEAFGDRLGFVAIWIQWIENVIWYPTVLSFTAATIAYIFNPELAHNKFYILTTILATFWGFTLINALGMRASGLISSVGVIIGTLIPASFIILLGIYWVISGQPIQTPFSQEALIPDYSEIPNIVFLVGVIFGLMGIEMAAVHAKEVKNPQKDYPRAIFLSIFIILTVSIMGSLAIAFVVPQNEISLVAGVMQAFTLFFQELSVPFLTPILALLLAVGSIAQVSTWIVGPSKGLFQTSHEGHIPPIFHKRNRFGMPISILIMQAVIVSLLSSAFLLMPTVSSSYWLLTDLTSLLYITMYMLLFASGIALRYKRPDVKRSYKIPGGKTWGMWLVAGIGLITCTFAFYIGFTPPAQLDTGSLTNFHLFLGIGVLTMLAAPLIIYACQKEHWKIDVKLHKYD